MFIKTNAYTLEKKCTIVYLMAYIIFRETISTHAINTFTTVRRLHNDLPGIIAMIHGESVNTAHCQTMLLKTFGR